MTKEDLRDLLDIIYLIGNVFIVGALACTPAPLGLYYFGPSVTVFGLSFILGGVLAIIYLYILVKYIKPRWLEIFDYMD